MTKATTTTPFRIPPAAVVFDCDGLLVDTEPCWTVAETEVFRRRGLPFGDDEKALVIGKSLHDAAVVLAETFGEPGGEEQIIGELMDLVATAVGSTAAAMPGAVELVEQVSAKVPVAVASNSPRHLLDLALERGGLTGAFEISIAADEVPRPKPAPDLYLEACRRLDAAPQDCLAFEDSSTGLRSAVAAGLRTVGVPTLQGRRLEADVVWAALTEPELLTWVDSW